MLVSFCSKEPDLAKFHSLGTLITNFVGPLRLAQEISGIYMSRLLDSHTLGPQALRCVWILAFAMLRTTAEQLDFAFEIFDPIDSSPHVSGFYLPAVFMDHADGH